MSFWTHVMTLSRDNYKCNQWLCESFKEKWVLIHNSIYWFLVDKSRARLFITGICIFSIHCCNILCGLGILKKWKSIYSGIIYSSGVLQKVLAAFVTYIRIIRTLGAPAGSNTVVKTDKRRLGCSAHQPPPQISSLVSWLLFLHLLTTCRHSLGIRTLRDNYITS